MKKFYFLIFSFFSSCALAMASNIRPIPDDSFSTQEKSDEAAKIINEDFQELWNSKIDSSTPAAGSASYYVSSLNDPEQSDYNAFVIMENADDLWRSKVDRGGVVNNSGRAYNLVDILDPDNSESSIAIINQIFYDLDSQKEE